MSKSAKKVTASRSPLKVSAKAESGVTLAPAISTPIGSQQTPATVVEQPMVTPAPKATDKLLRGEIGRAHV